MIHRHAVLIALSLASTQALAQVTFIGGHGDLGVALEGGTDFHFHVHLHGGAIVDGNPLADDEEYDADAITINVPAATELTAGVDLPAAGVSSGDSLWVLPQGNPGTNAIPFLGLAAEELVDSDWAPTITFALDSVVSPSGSGTFSLWQADGLGGLNFFFSSADEALTLNGDNTLGLAVGAHDHYNWGFSEPGLWQVELTASGTHDSLGPLSDTQTFSFVVVPEPSTVGLVVGSVGLLLALARRNRS